MPSAGHHRVRARDEGPNSESLHFFLNISGRKPKGERREGDGQKAATTICYGVLYLAPCCVQPGKHMLNVLPESAWPTPDPSSTACRTPPGRLSEMHERMSAW